MIKSRNGPYQLGHINVQIGLDVEGQTTNEVENDLCRFLIKSSDKSMQICKSINDPRDVNCIYPLECKRCATTTLDKVLLQTLNNDQTNWIIGINNILHISHIIKKWLDKMKMGKD